MTAELERLQRIDACALSDALDALELPGAVLGLAPLTVRRKVVGRVMTVDLGPASGPMAGSRHLGTAAIEACGRGDVIVVAAHGRLDAGAWGGVLSVAAATNGIEGIVLDGACRDIDECTDLELPVFGRAGVTRTARGRVVEVGWNCAVDVCGVEVRPGDWVLADGSGVVFVPSAQLQYVLVKAEQITEREAVMSARIRAGEPVSQVLSGSYETMLTGTQE